MDSHFISFISAGSTVACWCMVFTVCTCKVKWLSSLIKTTYLMLSARSACLSASDWGAVHNVASRYILQRSVHSDNLRKRKRHRLKWVQLKIFYTKHYRIMTWMLRILQLCFVFRFRKCSMWTGLKAHAYQPSLSTHLITYTHITNIALSYTNKNNTLTSRFFCLILFWLKNMDFFAFD